MMKLIVFFKIGVEISLSSVFTYVKAKLNEAKEKIVCIFVIPFVFLTIKILVANKNNKNNNFKLLSGDELFSWLFSFLL